MEDPDRTAADRRMASSKGGHAKWAKTVDRTAATEAMRTAANVTRYENQVDPDRVLDPATRAKMVKNARSAHMADLALKASKAKRLKAQLAQLEAEVSRDDDDDE